MTYVIKKGPYYADGRYNWVTRQRSAFRFFEEGRMTAREWAVGHMACIGEPLARVVRLVKKGGKR